MNILNENETSLVSAGQYKDLSLLLTVTSVTLLGAGCAAPIIGLSEEIANVLFPSGGMCAVAAIVLFLV